MGCGLHSARRAKGTVRMKRLLGLLVPLAGVALPVNAMASSVPSAAQVIQALIAKRLPARLTIAYTAATDPTHLLGRPNGYTSKANFSDRRISTSETPASAIDLGGSVEVYRSSGAAVTRVRAIQILDKADPLLGSEYDYLNGPVLVRVSGTWPRIRPRPIRRRWRS